MTPHETSIGNSCIARVWSAAATFERERDWRLLVEDALDALEARGYATPEDLIFLANTRTAPRTEIVTAVRLLGAIGEDGLAPIEGVRALLTDFLAHRDPAVRIATAEAAWQMADREITPILAAALEREEHPAVRDTLAHVLRLFA